ncbi:AAA family ATPase [Pontibacter sp. MBLB2868]|uniref:AAA family ATPase n=1 Tax=Pontibacter sp. MBLB2868 TaxID=3451555 RepID=UPI003F751489
MKILSVRFQNLNSLKGEHEIRFDQSPLAEAGLFAITGPTGAGKTTILDAITVGLYGMAHRHNNDKPLELMTRHTAESFSEVEFETDGLRYRSKWHLRRSRGKVDGNIQPVHMELYSFKENSLFDLKPSEVAGKVAEICGLDYSQFLRSVMLSQGDFARFLKATPNERSTLLEKITDTGIYSEISKYAFEKARTERQKRDDLERKLQDIELLPDEMRQAYTESINTLTNQETNLQATLHQLQEQVQWLQLVAQLQTKQQQNQSALQVQEQKLAQLQPEFQKLKHHEQAHQFVGELAEIRSANSKLSEVRAELQLLDKRLPELEAELELTGKTAIEADKAKAQQEEAQQKLEPLLEQVTKLDHQLSTIRDAYGKNKLAYVSFEEQLKLVQAQCLARQQELEKLTSEATSIKSWLKQNEKAEDLREHLPELRQTLKELQELGVRIQRNQQEQQELQKQLKTASDQAERLHQEQESQRQGQVLLEKQKQEKLAELQAELAGMTVDELMVAAQAQPALLAKYERLTDIAQQHTLLQQKMDMAAQQLKQQEQERTAKTTQLETTQVKLNDAKSHLEALQKIVELQKQIQQYDEARLSLTEEEPCPLCGSIHHPFVKDKYTFDLPEEVQKRDAQRNLVKELEAATNTLQLEIASLQHRLQLAGVVKAETETERQRLLRSFTEVAEGVPEQVSITDTTHLSLLLQTQQATADTLQKRSAQARAINRDLESINQQLQQNREAQVLCSSKQQQLQATSKHLQDQLQKLQAIHADDQEQQQVHTQMAESFAIAYGCTYSPDKRHELLLNLEKKAADFAQKQQALERMREAYIEVKEQVKNLQATVQERDKELQQRQEDLKQEHLELAKLKQVRSGLFGEKDPQKERQQAQQELRRLTSLAEEARARHQKKQLELKEARSRQSECQTKHQQNKSVLDELQRGLLRVLQQKGIETIEALSQMLLERDEADRLANLKAQVEKQLTELRKSLSDVQQELQLVQEKKLTNESMEKLQQLLLENGSEHREIIAQRARLQQLLEQDATQREKNRDLANQIKTQLQVYHRWSQLSDLIGSAEGTKFSRFAQGLTLARLVELANHHLQKLNDRYRIVKSTTEDLELLIIDTYQAEAVRPMNTLSGGESFLVSLALALGLSDLAGRRTQINSLFIDEGFGTLDGETLDAAISTLENLQASGKMIGIISHVEALKERIHTQVKLHRKAGGVSTVEVAGW